MFKEHVKDAGSVFVDRPALLSYIVLQRAKQRPGVCPNSVWRSRAVFLGLVSVQ